MHLDIYIDGSCDWKSRLGGIGVYIKNGSRAWCISEGFKDTTISRMEGLALLQALRSLNPDVEISATFVCDSEYVVKSFTENRLERWQVMNWIDVKNTDMWKSILFEIKQRPLLQFSFRHIRGHQVDISDAHVFGNHVADMLANYKTKSIYHLDTSLIKFS